MLQHFSTELDNLQKNSLVKVIYTRPSKLPAYGFTHANVETTIFDPEILDFVGDFAIIFKTYFIPLQKIRLVLEF